MGANVCRAQHCLCRCNTSAFRSSSTDWKKKAASDAQTLDEYAQLFGADEASTAVGTEVPDSNHTGVMAEVAKMSATASVEPVVGDAAMGKQKKKRKKDKSEAGRVEATADAVAPQPTKPSKKHKKKPAEVVIDGIDDTKMHADDAMALLGFAESQQKKHKKKQKSK